ncbi:hypothetical protein MRX96_010561 [Rhipicephalus microplus]
MVDGRVRLMTSTGRQCFCDPDMAAPSQKPNGKVADGEERVSNLQRRHAAGFVEPRRRHLRARIKATDTNDSAFIARRRNGAAGRQVSCKKESEHSFTHSDDGTHIPNKRRCARLECTTTLYHCETSRRDR